MISRTWRSLRCVDSLDARVPFTTKILARARRMPSRSATGTVQLVRGLVAAVRALRENLAAGVGDAERMFELRRQRAVAGDRRPAVVEHLHVRPSKVDHRLDGEEHARLELGPGAGAAGVDDLGTVMENSADSVAAEVADDAVAAGLGMALDGVGNVAEMIAGLGLLEAEHQAFVGDVDQLPGAQRHVADQIHAARVAVPAVDDRSDVDVDDVAVLERLVDWNAVADDMDDRNAAALGVAAVAQRCRSRARIESHLVDDVVELLGRDAGHYVRRERVQDFRRETAGPAHAFEALGTVELDDSVLGLDAVVCRDTDVLSHGAKIGIGRVDGQHYPGS